MKRFFTTLLLSIFLILMAFCSFCQVRVKGYYRKNGTYVQPHVRSSPDGNPYNNYSYPGNTNPYTGKTASGNESTYLNNYYDGEKSNQVTSVPRTRIASAPNKFFLDRNGNHAVKYSIESNVVRYYLYNSKQNMIGKIFYFEDGDMCIYDLSNKLIKRNQNTSVESIKSESDAAQYNPSSYISNSNIQQAKASSPSRIKIRENGTYGIEYYKDEIVTKYYLYSSNDMLYGKAYYFADGDMCVYDLSNNLLSNRKYK
jgi:hypothetical protein